MRVQNGTKGDDILWGTPLEVDVIFGGAGDDRLTDTLGADPSMPSDDIYIGGKGDDFFYSRDGDDIIRGNQGDDEIIVNAHEGTVIVSGGRGVDTITVLGDPDMDGFKLITHGIEHIDWSQ